MIDAVARRAAGKTRVARAPRLVVALLATAALASGCADRGDTAGFAARAASELRATDIAARLGIQQPSRTFQRGAWSEFYFDPAAEQAICLDGSEFQVNVRHGTSSDVLLYLQGGGACWDYQSCYVEQRALMKANGALPIGALDVDDPASPFKDWNIVYVPYCDGSIYGADTTVDYDGVRTFHHGLWNLSVAVDAITREFPQASRIVVSGSSAGGYGTVPGYAVTRVAFPDTPIDVFDDSGPALENQSGIANAALRAANWRAAEHYPASCAECGQHGLYLLDWALGRDTRLRVALYSYLRDGTIMSFFEWDQATYRNLLLSVTGEIHDRHPERFERYFVDAMGHTILQFGAFYTQTVDGVRVADWTQAFLDGSDAWRDVVQ